MDELTRWLGQQLDEDERIALTVEDRSAPWDGQWMADGNSAVRTYNGHVLFYRHGPDPLKPGLADHVAEWDPARVLREIDAKRRLLELHRPDNFDGASKYTTCVECSQGYEMHEWGPKYPCGTVRLLVLPYADRPGYREEWRP